MAEPFRSTPSLASPEVIAPVCRLGRLRPPELSGETVGVPSRGPKHRSCHREGAARCPCLHRSCDGLRRRSRSSTLGLRCFEGADRTGLIRSVVEGLAASRRAGAARLSPAARLPDRPGDPCGRATPDQSRLRTELRLRRDHRRAARMGPRGQGPLLGQLRGRAGQGDRPNPAGPLGSRSLLKSALRAETQGSRRLRALADLPAPAG